MTNIFDLKFAAVNKQEDLEQLCIDYPKIDPGYINTATSPMLERQKNLIEEMWSIYKAYADPGFTQKIKINGEFLGRCWEMTVASTLLNLGYSLEQKRTARGPDIKITSVSPTVWVEAVSCTSGNGPDALPDLLDGEVQYLPIDELLLRFANAVVSKSRKHQAYLNSGVIKHDEPFVIAVSKGSILHPDPVPSLVLRYLFGVGNIVLHMPLNPVTGERTVVESSNARQPAILKKEGEKVPVAFFEDPANVSISAILYSDKNILNHPARLGDDFVLVRNPNATAPLPANFFAIGAEWVPEEKHLVYKKKL